MHFTDAVVFPIILWTARSTGKGINIGTDVMSRVSFQLFYKDIFASCDIPHILYFFSKFVHCTYCILLHAVIFLACCFTLVCRNKSPTGLMLHVCEYSTKNKISMSSMSINCFWK